MNTSDSPPDDSHWSSLAHELGLDSDPAPTPPAPQPTPLEVHPPAHAPHADLPDAADEDDTMIEPGLNTEPVAEGNESEETTGEDGGEGGEKRRRRRRRRRRKGGDAAAPATTAEGGEEQPAETEEEEAAFEDEPTEAPAHDAMRDVVANWNVPSWDELIGGLYRPGN